jgi:hypothetical protein
MWAEAWLPPQGTAQAVHGFAPDGVPRRGAWTAMSGASVWRGARFDQATLASRASLWRKPSVSTAAAAINVL